MKPHLFLFPLVFSLGFLAGYQWAWLSENTLDRLLSSSSSSSSIEDLPIGLKNVMLVARLVILTLQEAVALLLWTNFTLIILLVPLLFATAVLLLATLALFSKVSALNWNDC